jgi:predicted MFS family arabinose efflux permease
MHPVDSKRAVLLLCCAIYALGAWPASRLELDGEQRKQSGPWRFDPFLFRFLPAVALWSFAAGSFGPFASAFLSRYVHISLAHIGVIFSASQLAQVVAVLCAPLVFKRCGLVIGIMYMQIAAAIALAGLARTHHLPLIVVFYLSFTAFHWMSGPGIHSLLMNRVAEIDRSSAAAANIFVTSLCQAIASAVSGAAIVDFGYPAVLTAIAGLALLAALLFWALLREGHSPDSVMAAPAEC